MSDKFGISVKRNGQTLFDSNRPSIQVWKAATTADTYPGSPSGSPVTKTTVITHNLGYKPMVYVYLKAPSGGIIPVAGVSWFCNKTTARLVMNDNTFEVKVSNYGGSVVAAFSYAIYYYIMEIPIYPNNDPLLEVKKVYPTE